MVITTAVVPGKKAPVLVTAEMVQAMAPGSVIVDLAAERGGNCELTRAEETIVRARRDDHRQDQSGEHRAVPREPDVRAEPDGFPTHLAKDGKLNMNLEDDIIARDAGDAGRGNCERAGAGVFLAAGAGALRRRKEGQI